MYEQIIGGLITISIAFFLGIVIGAKSVYLIKSDVKLKPKIELVVVDNKVDTLYVYKKQ